MPVFVETYEITDDQVHAEMQHHPAASLEDARREAARALVIKHLLLKAAADRELITETKLSRLEEDQEEEIIENLLAEVIQLPEADDKTCKRYYDQHQDRFIDKTTGEALPYPMVKAHIKNYLEDKGHMAAFNAFVDSLMDQSNIVGLN